ncbi:MAG: PilZ domain-containing protein [Oligoflexales bacterium]|nr:PilZ domain-containing protein [Oligoflexales bacterium]
MQNTREHYRIVYPVSARPVLRLRGKNFFVADISEQGLRFIYDLKHKAFGEGSRINAELIFQDGETLSVKGIVLRHQEDSIIVNLEEPIPLRKIMSEQIYLLNKYPDHFREKSA